MCLFSPSTPLQVSTGVRRCSTGRHVNGGRRAVAMGQGPYQSIHQGETKNQSLYQMLSNLYGWVNTKQRALKNGTWNYWNVML